MRSYDASVDALGAANALWDDSVNAQVRLMLRGGGGAELADLSDYLGRAARIESSTCTASVAYSKLNETVRVERGVGNAPGLPSATATAL